MAHLSLSLLACLYRLLAGLYRLYGPTSSTHLSLPPESQGDRKTNPSFPLHWLASQQDKISNPRISAEGPEPECDRLPRLVLDGLYSVACTRTFP